jgi:hypothetical protein
MGGTLTLQGFGPVKAPSKISACRPKRSSGWYRLPGLRPAGGIARQLATWNAKRGLLALTPEVWRLREVATIGNQRLTQPTLSHKPRYEPVNPALVGLAWLRG